MLNDVTQLKTHAPSLRVVAFNGKKAATHAGIFAAQGCECCVLPSSSPANASVPVATQLEQWINVVRNYIMPS